MILASGLILLKLLLKLHRSEVVEKERVKTTPEDLGQRLPQADRGRVDNLTQDDIEWARELGAETDQEILDLVRKHVESLR